MNNRIGNAGEKQTHNKSGEYTEKTIRKDGLFSIQSYEAEPCGENCRIHFSVLISKRHVINTIKKCEVR